MSLLALKVLASSITVICPGAASNTAHTPHCSTGLPQVSATTTTLQPVLQIVFGIIAAVAVLIIVLNGFKLVTSQGSPDAVAKTRDAVIAASIGLVVAISAEIIVSFVLGRL